MSIANVKRQQINVNKEKSRIHLPAVASSSINILLFLKRARAKHNNCLSPELEQKWQCHRLKSFDVTSYFDHLLPKDMTNHFPSRSYVLSYVLILTQSKFLHHCNDHMDQY